MPYEPPRAFHRVCYFCVFQRVRLDVQLAATDQTASHAVRAMHHRHKFHLTLVEVNLSIDTFSFFTVMLLD